MPDNSLGATVDALPTFMNPQAWLSADKRASQPEWTYRFTAADIAEIDDAVARGLASGRALLDVGQADMPLPTLAPKLAEIRQEVLHGGGMFMLQGLPVDRYSREEAIWAYWALGAYWGEPCSQNHKGHVLGHVKDLGYDLADPKSRGYYTKARLPYHTDSSDIVALLCFKPAMQGGRSSAVSSTAVWNELVARRPDLAAELLKPVCRTRYGEVPEGRKRYAEFAIFKPWDGRMVCTYLRGAIRKAQLFPETPRLTETQIEALDLMDALTEDPELHLDMDFQPGDIQLLNNHFILHSRTAFEDFPEPDRKRHLLRLWLACDDGPSLPPVMTEGYQGRTAGGRPNGIHTPGVPFATPMDAE